MLPIAAAVPTAALEKAPDAAAGPVVDPIYAVIDRHRETYEAGLNQRTVVIEFDSMERALAAYDSAGYQATLKALDGKAERDMRVIVGAS